MKLIKFLASFTIVLSSSLVSGENCDKYGILLYEDLGCTSSIMGKTCPTKYDCKGLVKWSKNCHFQGKLYEIFERVDMKLSSPCCQVECFCGKFENTTNFSCAILDCAEWLGQPIQPDCFRKYSLDSCCSTGQTCPPLDNIGTCLINGEKYREGEVFYPKNTCLKCVCHKDFKGKLEAPYCRRLPCGVQLHPHQSDKLQEKCAPIYRKYDDVICCPKNWICRDGNEAIKGEPVSELSCMFGQTTLRVGQYFHKNNVRLDYSATLNIRCNCSIPPLLTCLEL